MDPGNLSPFSSPGPTRDGRQKPDIAAPGSVIISTLTQDISPTCPTTGSTYIADSLQHQVMQGTSMAAPHVAGAAALILQKYGAVSPSFVKQFLRDRAIVDSYTGTVWNSSWGAGKLWLGDMADPVVAVTYPNGGELFVGGTTENLAWTATDNVGVTSVDLLLSRSGAGGTYETIATGIANTGSYPWVVTLPGSENCWLKVVAHDAAGNTGSDVSDMLFAIVEPVVPTLMTEFVAEATASGIELRWAFGDPAAFSSVRAERAATAEGPWTVLGAAGARRGGRERRAGRDGAERDDVLVPHLGGHRRDPADVRADPGHGGRGDRGLRAVAAGAEPDLGPDAGGVRGAARGGRGTGRCTTCRAAAWPRWWRARRRRAATRRCGTAWRTAARRRRASTSCACGRRGRCSASRLVVTR